MTELYLFSDEAGDMEFQEGHNISRYFILCTVTTTDLAAGFALYHLRRQLIRDGLEVGDMFHACVDNPQVRNAVYDEMIKYPFRVQATICQKNKANPSLRQTKADFFSVPWNYHLRHAICPHVPESAHLHVTTASIGVKRERAAYRNGVESNVERHLTGATYSLDFRPAASDPWLQVADYCAWAIQRKWERNDTAKYDLIEDRITYQYDLWQRGQTIYYGS